MISLMLSLNKRSSIPRLWMILSTASLCDEDPCVEVIQACWMSCFSDSLKHTLELLPQMRLYFILALDSIRS